MLILVVEEGDVGGGTAVAANTRAGGPILGKEESVALTAGVIRWWVGREDATLTGTNLKPRKLLENAQTPTSRVYAVLGGS
ncbi:MAG: hypothetical protein KJ069_26725 [Anaerolineae bacterium]|nr:hypothetical protein [Anaerolineae bacterium]